MKMPLGVIDMTEGVKFPHLLPGLSGRMVH